MTGPIGVVAGSPVDARFGVEYLTARGLRAAPYPTAEDPAGQSALQILPESERYALVRGVFRRAMGDGMGAIMVYCNSLSSTVDIDAMSAELGIKAVTPLHVYSKLAALHNALGILAGNCQGLAGIERAVWRANPRCEVMGISLHRAVVAIEAGEPAAQVAKRCGMADALSLLGKTGVEAVVLGCTHFSYVALELKKVSALSLIDPSEQMCRLLCE